jgi:integrase
VQTRPHAEQQGIKLWLNQSEQYALLANTDDRDGRPRPERKLALSLGLHGLRTDEIVPSSNGPGVTEGDVRALENEQGYVLEIQDGKTTSSKREVPLAPDVARDIFSMKRAARARQDDPIIDYGKRTLRKWVKDAAEGLEPPANEELSMHDLRRTWATQTFYALAMDGVPIAEALTMSWGGWAQNQNGRSTFREAYLGPVPDHVVRQCLEAIPYETGPER